MDKHDEVEINLIKLVKRLWKRLPIILLAALFTAIAAFFYFKSPTVKIYTAQSTFFVENNLMVNEEQISISDDQITLNHSFLQDAPTLKTVCYVATARSTLEAVISKEALPYTIEELSKIVTVTSKDNVSAFSVVIKSPSSYEALRIAHAFANVLPEEFRAISPSLNLQVLDFGSVTEELSGGYYFKKSAIVGFVGAFLAACIIAVKYVLDEISENVEINVSDIQKVFPKYRLLSLSSRKGFDREAMNRLRSNLLLSLSDDSKSHIIGVTAPCEEKGKNAFSVDLASSLANTGRKVLLVDAEIRSPTLHDLLGLSRENGLSDALDSKKASCDLIQKYSSENGIEFSFLSSGAGTDNQTGFSDQKKIAPVLDELRSAYDVVILNLTEIGTDIDAASIGKQADGNIVFLCENRCTRKQLYDCIEQLKFADAPITGLAVAKR